MLQCQNLVKDYYVGDEIVHAIKNLSVTLRDNEFVSILGPSGCGKTTLLNIIGGLDQYNSGDLIINGVSTKNYTDADWDTYRNHRIGFVFQSYNLIMHQSVLKNVEMSLTLSGVGKEERRKRALQALEKVGLKDQVNKKPTQMSGGQMQRVAIARALVNNPDIVLADEPTGALDSETSVQIMDLLKEVAKDRLVVMVTHNPELAKQYSTRLITLKDGQITSDSNPVSEQEAKDESGARLKKPSMSFLTALSLSFNNLMTKKGRTLLTSFAGSIGIIGIGLIMSLSNGVQEYINRVENDTMESYPITLKDNTMDMSVMINAMMDMRDEDEVSEELGDTVKTKSLIHNVLNSISSTETNNLASFKKYIESDDGKAFQENAKAIEYGYGIDLNIYNEHAEGKKLVRVSPNELLDELGFAQMGQAQQMMGISSPMSSEIWKKLPDSQILREENYELVAGEWPENEFEVVLQVDEDNEITDYTLYSLGLLNQDELIRNYQNVMAGKTDKVDPGEIVNFKTDDLLGMDFKLVEGSSFYEKVNGVWIDRSDDEDFVKKMVENGKTITISGIVRPSEKTVSSSSMGAVMYDSKLMSWESDQAKKSAIVQEQMKDPDINVFTGQEFSEGKRFSMDDLTQEQMMQLAGMDQQQMLDYIATYNDNINATYDGNLAKLGVIDEDVPTSISLYASTFDEKEKLSALITDYNEMKEAEGKPEDIITYTDTVGTMLSGIQQVINMISYVLIGFVGVSLIVSSIMIGIITYISVLERRKEIGILRAMGASKRDVRNVFNAETFIIGLASGLIGILLTVILDIPISIIVENLTGVASLAVLPWQGALILVAINLVLTMIAGLIPASIASRKNPVEALRTE